jgi:hypothetical protein
MIRNRFGLNAVVFWLLVSAVHAASDRPYYLMDNRVVASAKGVQLEVCPPKKGGPVLRQEKPWEAFYIHPLSLVEHNGEYLLYYLVYITNDGANRSAMCLAVSKDGLKWERPELGQVEYAASKANNLVAMPCGPPSVNVDPKAPPEHRFLVLGTEPQSNLKAGDPNFVVDRLILYTSADGRTWRETTGPLAPFTCDSSNQVYYDSAVKTYRVYVRAIPPGRRAVAWYEPPDLLKPWPIRPAESNKASTFNSPYGPAQAVYIVNELPIAIDLDTARQVYNPGVVPIEGMYLAFPDIFRVFPGPGHPDKNRFPQSELYQWSNDGFVAPALFVSEDGRSFRRIGASPYIDLGAADELDAKQVRMIAGFIRQGNEIWQYYGGQRTSHTLQRGTRPRRGSDVMRAIQRKDGFAAMTGGPEGGEVVTVPLICSGAQLAVNYDAGAWGEIRVELLNAEGNPLLNYTLADSAPLVANEVYGAVQWSDRRDLAPLAGKQIRIRFCVKDARLFSFRFKSVG